MPPEWRCLRPPVPAAQTLEAHGERRARGEAPRCRWDPPPGSGAAPPGRPRPREQGGGGWGRSRRSRWGDGPASASRQHQSRRRRGSGAHGAQPRAQPRARRGRGGGAWSTASAGLSPGPGGGGGGCGGDVGRSPNPVRSPARLAAGGGPRACPGPCLGGGEGETRGRRCRSGWSRRGVARGADRGAARLRVSGDPRPPLCRSRRASGTRP